MLATLSKCLKMFTSSFLTDDASFQDRQRPAEHMRSRGFVREEGVGNDEVNEYCGPTLQSFGLSHLDWPAKKSDNILFGAVAIWSH